MGGMDEESLQAQEGSHPPSLGQAAPVDQSPLNPSLTEEEELNENQTSSSVELQEDGHRPPIPPPPPPRQTPLRVDLTEEELKRNRTSLTIGTFIFEYPLSTLR